MLLFSKIYDKKLCFIFANAKNSNFVKLSRKQCVPISSWNAPKVFRKGFEQFLSTHTQKLAMHSLITEKGTVVL